jgi:fructose-bisphosphate aldolase class II
MTRATLTDVFGPSHAVAGFVCLGWEDARAYVAAAEAEQAPVILQAGPGARAHMPLAVWGAMLGALADAATVPVVVHLDHGESVEVCEAAIATGFTSVMFDGSALPLADNIAQTARIATLAHAAGVSCEGEIGFVGYAAGAAGRGTDPAEAAQFADRTGVDAMAVSVGNVHLVQAEGARLDENLIAAIRAVTATPLVIHGGSGVPADQCSALARTGAVAKFNIGTQMRQVWGTALRETLNADAAVFDRIAILQATESPLAQAAARVIAGLR